MGQKISGQDWMSFAQMGGPHTLPKFGEEMGSVDHFWTNGVPIGLCILLLNLHMNRFGQLGKIWRVPLEMP